MSRLLLLLLTVPLAAVAEVRVASSVSVDRPVNEDLYALAGEVTVQSAITGTALLAAGDATLSGDVAADVVLAGGQVRMDGGVGDDLRVAGGNVELGGFVTDQATIAGGNVLINPGTAIGGRTWIAAGNVELGGDIGADLRVVARTVLISGRIAGNVDITAREIRLASGTQIGGDFNWESDQPPLIAEGVEIIGSLAGPDGPAPSTLLGDVDVEAPVTDGLGFGIALALSSAMVLWLAPGLIARSAATFRAAPGRTILLGLASAVFVPLLVVLLFVTVLGWLLGLVVMAGYLFGLLLAGLVGLLIVAEAARQRFGGGVGVESRPGWRSLLVAVLLIAGLVVVQRVPWLGQIAATLVFLAGLGALTILVTGRDRAN
jgi:hypothetical protein